MSMMFDFGEVFFVKSKDSLCTIDRVDNTPKMILVKKTKNKEKTRGGIDVFITIYGVPTKLLREDGTILDRIGESMTKIYRDMELTSEYTWTTSPSDPRQSIAVVRGRRAFIEQAHYRVSLVGEVDILLDVNITTKEANLSGPVNYYTLPGQSTGERRMILGILKKRNNVTPHNDILVHSLSARIGKSHCSAIAVYGSATNFSSKVGNYAIKNLNRLLDISENCSDPPLNTYMYSAGAISKLKQDKVNYKFLKDIGDHYVGHLFDDQTRESVYVTTKKIDDYASRGLSVVKNNRKNNQNSGPSEKGSGAI